MQMVCHIQQSDGTELFVIPQMLNFIENPGIASNPQTNEEYYDECHYLDSSDLEKIVHSQPLSPLQEEMMSHHYRLHHTPFPRLIVMAELGEIYEVVAQYAPHAYLVLLTSILREPSPRIVVIQFTRNQTCLWVPELQQKHSSELNLDLSRK
jgi:hypothetical protein